MKTLFRNAHALAKQRKSYRDFEWICNLVEKQGVEVGSTYRSDKQAATFIKYIAKVEKQSLLTYLNSAKFLTIIVDGCTDTSRKEEEIVYIRSSVDGEIKTNFLSIGSPEADANGIMDVIQNSMTGIKAWEKKIVGLGSDGANVMMGKNGGVVKKLKDIQPCLIGVHCFAHRLELAYKQAIKTIQPYTRMQQLLSGLYYFYYNSPLHAHS